MECKFEIGQDVVYLLEGGGADFGFKDDFCNTFPTYRGIYKVRDIVICRCCGIVGLLLKEIVNKPHPTEPDGALCELAFYHEYFAPVRKTKIDVFTALLQTKPKVKQNAS